VDWTAFRVRSKLTLVLNRYKKRRGGDGENILVHLETRDNDTVLRIRTYRGVKTKEEEHLIENFKNQPPIISIVTRGGR